MSEPRPRVSEATYARLVAFAAARGLTVGGACDDLVRRAFDRFASIDAYEQKRNAKRAAARVVP